MTFFCWSLLPSG